MHPIYCNSCNRCLYLFVCILSTFQPPQNNKAGKSWFHLIPSSTALLLKCANHLALVFPSPNRPGSEWVCQLSSEVPCWLVWFTELSVSGKVYSMYYAKRTVLHSLFPIKLQVSALFQKAFHKFPTLIGLSKAASILTLSDIQYCGKIKVRCLCVLSSHTV